MSDKPLTDTDRMNALFTLFGGNYAFTPFFELQQIMRDGRRGFDAFLAEHLSLLPAARQEEGK